MIKREKVTFRVSAKDIYQKHKSVFVISLLSVLLISFIVILASSIENAPDVRVNNNAREMSFDLNDNSINLGFSLVNPDSSNSFSESSEVPTESFEVVMKENTKDYSKWGYKVKLNNQEFTAKVPISSDKTITISSSDSLTIGNKILSFSDLTNTGYTITIESLDEYNANVYISKDFSDVISSNVNEINSSTNKTPASSFTLTNNTNSSNESLVNSTEENQSINSSNVSQNNETLNTTNDTTPSSFTLATDISVDYEDTDNSNTLSLGDILYLDPTLSTINFLDISVNSLSINTTEENNFTHLSLIADTFSNPWRGFNYTTSSRTFYPPYLASDDTNSYAHLDGDNDYISVPNSNSLNFVNKNQITMSVWVYPIGSAETWHSVISKGASQQYALTINKDTWYAHFETNQMTGGSCDPTNSPANSIRPNTWNSVITVFNATDKAIFINGILTVSANCSSNFSDNTQVLELGRDGDSEEFNGSIDNILILNRSLSSAQVTALYNLGRRDITYTDPSLVSAWRLDNTNLSNAYDSIGTNNGTFAGGLDFGMDSLGLLLYYPFDVNSTAKTYDYSGNDIDGILNGGMVWNSSCLYGPCYNFDGTNDYINLGTTNNLPYTFTLYAWIKPASNVPSGSRFGIFSAYTPGWLLDIPDDGNVESFRFFDGVNTYNYYVPGGLISREWTQVVVTRDSSNNLTIWLNSDPKQSWSVPTIYGSNNNISIGRRSDGYYFNGTMDEVMIFNKALNATEILNLYNNVSRRFAGPGSQILLQQNITTGENPFNTTSILVNVSANFSSTLIPQANVSAKLGSWNVNQTIGSGTAYKNYDLGEHWAQFSGSSYINMSNPSNLRITGNLTISAWIYPKNATNDVVVAGKIYYIDGTNNGGYLLRQNQDKWEIDIGNNAWGYVYKSNAVSLNTWQHIVGVYNGSTIVQMYINGVPQTAVGVASAPSSIKDISQPFGIAYVENSTYFSNKFNGNVDEVMVFNRSLTSSEILSLYSKGRDIDYYNDANLVSWYGFDSGNSRDKKGSNHGTDTSVVYNQSNSLANGLVSYYHFDEASWAGTAGEVKDAMGLFNGTAINSTNITRYDNLYSKAGNFTGNSSRYVNTSLSTQFTNFTVSVWFKSIGSGGTYDRIVDKKYDTGFWIGRQGSLSNRWGGGIIQPAAPFGIFMTLNDGQWHHIVFTRNGTTNNLWGDGVLGNSSIVSASAIDATNIRFGLNSIGTNVYNGLTDEVMIFNRTLSTSEIQELYIKGRANWNYTDPQNLTVSGMPKVFNLTSITTNILPVFDFISDSNSFFSPAVFTTLTSRVLFNVTADTVPMILIENPSNGSYWNNATPFFNISSTEYGLGGNIIPNLDNSLISWWRMDDANSTTIFDFMGRNNGTIIGEAHQINNGKFGKALDFDGGNDYINVLDSQNLNLSNSITIAAWIKPVDSTTNLIEKYGINWSDANEWNSPGGLISWDSSEDALKIVNYRNTYLNDNISIDTTNGYYLEYNIKQVIGTSRLDYSGTHSYDSAGTMLPGHPGSYDYFCDSGNTFTNNTWNYRKNTYISGGPRTGESSSVSSISAWHTGTRSATVMFLFNYAGDNQVTYIKNLKFYESETGISKRDSYELAFSNTSFSGKINNNRLKYTLNNDNWNYVVLTYDRSLPSNQQKLYLNGILVNQTTLTELINRSGNNLTFYLNGSLDDVMIFNRSLTSEEVLSSYNASKLQHGGINLTNGTHNIIVYSQDIMGNLNSTASNFTIDTVPGTINIFSPANGTVTNNPNVTFNVSTSDTQSSTIIPNVDGSLLGWWRMDDLNSSGDIADYLGKYNALRKNDSIIVDTGKFGKGVSFDGNGDYVLVTNVNALNPVNITASAWFKTSSATQVAGAHILGKATGCASAGYLIWINQNGLGQGRISWYVGNGPWLDAPASVLVNDGLWHQVVGTYDGSNKTIYVDGVPRASATETGDSLTTATALQFGDSETCGNSFNGLIDDVMIFNRTLSNEEILAMYNATSYVYSINLSDKNHSLRAYVQDIAANINVSQINFTTDTTASSANLTMPLNRSISNYAVNFTANLSDNLAGIKNATLTVFDLSGNQWLNFNGSNSVNISNSNSLNLVTNFSISTWVRLSEITSRGILEKTIGGGVNTQYLLFTESSRFKFRVTKSTLNTIQSNSDISSGIWYHVVGIYNGTDIVMYINGVKQTNTASVAAPIDGGVGTTLIGVLGGGVYPMNGSIDEIRIYNRTLNSSEIEQIYYSKLNSNSDLPGDGLVSWYNMQPDSSNLTRLIDRVAGVNNGTIYGATYTSSYSSVITYAANTLTTTVGIVINVVEGVYNWFYDVFDVVGNEYITSNYTVIVDTTSPSIEFISPTPLNNSGVDENFFVNVSMRETHLANVTYSWNGTNYTINLFNNNASNYDVNPFNLSKGLVSYWHFDEPSWNGTTGEVKDVMGRNNGSAANSANVSSGVHGSAASFNGDAQYISVGNNSNLNPSLITISAWVNPIGTDWNNKGIVTKWNSSDTKKTSYALDLKGWCYQNELFFEINNGSSTYQSASCVQANSLQANRWYFVVGTYNGTDVKVYVNGTLTGSTTVAGNINASISNVYIGQYDNSLYRYRFPGSIDEVMIYNRSLTDDEIKSLYNSRLGVYYNPDRYTFENYSNNKTFMSLESPGLDWTNWTLTVNQSGLASGLNYTYLASARDLAVNTNMTEIRSIKGSIIPNFYSVTQNPFANNTNYLDPGLNVTISTEVYDPDGNQESAILQWRNSSGTDWTNQTMNNITNISLYTTFSINLTLPSYEDNITYRIWANDSSGVNNVSRNYTFNSFWDCTWNQTTQLGAFAGWDENKYLTNITIYNTGDPEYSERNCTLDFRTTYDLMEGRVYLDNSKYKRKQYLGLVAKSNISIEINATFLSEVKEETAKITFEEISGVSNSSSRNSSATLISTTGGPYLYQKIEPDVSSYLYLTPQNFSLGSYIRDIVADGYVNTTAYDVSFNWSLPYGFLVLAGTPNISFENLSNNSLNYNNINITFNETNLGYLTPQIVSVYIYASGHNSSNDLIPHSGNRTLLMQQSNITLLCYNETDGVCVPNCGYSKDPDCVESAASSGGGGGGGSANNGREEQSKAGFELLSGRVQVFQLPIENKYPYAKENLKISVSGINSQYIKISPDTISRIDPMSSKNITVTITAPAYFSKGEYKLTFVITGDLLSGGTKEVVTERKLVTLYIVELPKEETSSLINESWRFIAEMNSSKMILSDVLTLYSEMQNSYNKMDYISVKNNYEKIKEIRDSAFSSKQIIAELESKIKQAEKDGISVLETKKILYTSESAFARGDYSLAKERLNEAKLTFAIETKGEFNLLYVVKNNPIKSGASILGFALFAFAASIALRLSLYKKKLKALTEEEKLLLELMKVIQRECFTNNHMSMDEYGQAMSQYETRLSKAIEEKIEAEAKIANLMKIKGRKRALEDERKRLVELVKKIQEDYMNKGIIETRIYENMIKSYSGRLAEVEEELTFFDAQEALSENKWSRRLLRLVKLSK